MSHQLHNNPPELKRRISLPVIAGIVFMGAVMICLPLSQFIAESLVPPVTQVEPQDELPIPEMVIKPPPKDEVEDPDIDDPEDIKDPPPLKPMQVVFDPPDYDNLRGDEVWIPGVTTRAIDEIFSEMDLTKAPRPLRRKSPVYPNELRLARIPGKVIVSFVVRADGSVTQIRILSSTHQAFSDAAISAIRKWFFEAGEKDGRKVNARVRQAIPFNIK